MEAFDPDQSEASLFVGTYRVVQQDFNPKIVMTKVYKVHTNLLTSK